MSNFDSRVYFDRIVCDVPCSSDAAIRKIPKKWETWDPIDGAALHPLQLKILLRSLLMLKPNSDDSYLTYSTCSLNPIENEAVVYAALKKLNEDSGKGEEFEIVDCRDKLGSFKTRPGLHTWKVYDTIARVRRRRFKKEQAKEEENNQDKKEGEGEKEAKEEDKKEEEKKDLSKEYKTASFEEYFQEYKSLEDINEPRRNKFKQTFYPPEGTPEEIEAKYHLSRCVRVFPNDQNTSGFFIVLFKRKPLQKPAEDVKMTEEVKKEPEENKVVPIQKPLKNMIRCDPKDPDIEFIQTYYGLSDDFPLEQIFTFSSSMNKLLIINKGLSDLFYADQEKSLNLIAGGAETFIRNNSKKFSGTECIYRISQNGVYHVHPFMTKRKFFVDMDTFLLVLNSDKIQIEDLPESDFKTNMDSLSVGCFVVVTKIGEDKEEALVLHRHHSHINIMVSDLNLHKIRTCLNNKF